MKKLYKVAEKLAKKAFQSYGAEISFTQTSEVVSDLAKGKKIASTATFTGFGVRSEYNKREIDGTTVKSGDIKIILEATDVVPKIGDTAEINGSGVFRVMSIELIAPAEETIVYTLQLRK